MLGQDQHLALLHEAEQSRQKVRPARQFGESAGRWQHVGINNGNERLGGYGNCGRTVEEIKSLAPEISGMDEDPRVRIPHQRGMSSIVCGPSL